MEKQKTSIAQAQIPEGSQVLGAHREGSEWQRVMDASVVRFSEWHYRADGTVCPSSHHAHGPIVHRPPPAVFQAKSREGLVEGKCWTKWRNATA